MGLSETLRVGFGKALGSHRKGLEQVKECACYSLGNRELGEVCRCSVQHFRLSRVLLDCSRQDGVVVKSLGGRKLVVPARTEQEM